MIWIIMGAVLITALALLFYLTKKDRVRLKQEIQARFKAKDIKLMDDESAYFLAQESCGYSQKSGNGVLILTDKELYFNMLLIKKKIIIPLRSITQVGEAKRMKGQSSMRTLLKVDFKTDKGEDDAIAIYVKDLETWKSAIQQRRLQ